MTKEEFVKQLKIVAAMGDKQIETLANLLIDYFGVNENRLGFQDKKEDDAKV